MAVSGSTDFSLNRDEVIDKSLELLGVKEATITPSAAEVTQAASWLNLMLKEWQVATQNSLWVRKTGTLFLESNKVSYNLGTGVYAATGTTYETTTDTAHIATDTVIGVALTPWAAASGSIGILLDDGTIHWTTITGYVGDTSYTIAAGLPSAAASGNKVYVYTNVAHRPQKIMEAVLRNSSNNDTPLEFISQSEYMEISDKGQSGTPSLLYLDMQLGDAVLYPWPKQDSNDTQIIYKYIKHYDDMDASTDDLEFPVEWTMAIIYGLAMHLANVYAVDEEVYARIARTASLTFKRANNYDIEDTSIEFEPDPSEMR